MHLLFDLFPNLEKLRIPQVTKNEIQSDGALCMPPRSRTPPKRLRSLSASNVTGWSDMDPSNLIRLPRKSIQELNFSVIDGVMQLIETFRAFPHLTSLTITNLTFAEHTADDSTAIFPEKALDLMDCTLGPLPNLAILHLGEVPFEYDVCIVRLLSRTPNLREFTASHVYDMTAAALAAYCPKSRVLRFNAVHCSSNCTRRFFTPDELRGFERIEHKIDAREVVE